MNVEIKFEIIFFCLLLLTALFCLVPTYILYEKLTDLNKMQFLLNNCCPYYGMTTYEFDSCMIPYYKAEADYENKYNEKIGERASCPGCV